MSLINLRHGIFLPPFHPNEENPTQCLERDLELMVWLDKLGFHEAWIGEHHSAGFEIISSPEIFIAFAAERTKNIRFGTGVISLPYHHPMMVADRIVQLDHMTRGRVMFGAGPGLLASDAIMMGIDPLTQRDRMAESLDAILRLFRGEIITEKTDWYTMEGCRLHLLPYTKPYPEVAVVSAVTPSGGRLAGKYDLGMICVAATNPFGFDALGSNWQIACDVAAEHGREMDPNRLRLVGPMHIAETRERAFANARFGFEKYLGYLNNNQPRFIVPSGQDPLEWFVENRYGVCGTPGRCDRADRAVAGEAGRLWRVPAASPQLGRFRGDQALLRAICALCDATFQSRQRAARRLLSMVRRQPRRVQRQAQRRREGDVRPARSRAGRRPRPDQTRHRPPRARPRSLVARGASISRPVLYTGKTSEVGTIVES